MRVARVLRAPVERDDRLRDGERDANQGDVDLRDGRLKVEAERGAADDVLALEVELVP